MSQMPFTTMAHALHVVRRNGEGTETEIPSEANRKRVQHRNPIWYITNNFISKSISSSSVVCWFVYSFFFLFRWDNGQNVKIFLDENGFDISHSCKNKQNATMDLQHKYKINSSQNFLWIDIHLHCTGSLWFANQFVVYLFFNENKMCVDFVRFVRFFCHNLDCQNFINQQKTISTFRNFLPAFR